MKHKISNLVFEGGGVKGLAYAGVMEVLQERGVIPQIQRVAGTSVGAINATLFALGYTVQEQKEILSKLNFMDFLDDDWWIVSIYRIFSKFGWHSGDFFSKWIGGLVEKKVGKASATFRDLHLKGQPALHLYGSNISLGRCELFSFDTTPDMEIRKAVRISMSIPFFFSSIKNNGHYYADGGLFLNYPIRAFDDLRYLGVINKETPVRDSNQRVLNESTLGFRLDTKEEIQEFRHGKTPKGKKIGRVDKYLVAVFEALMRVQETQHLDKEDWDRTIYIDTLGISTFDFDMSAADKLKLIDAGREAAREYFDWLDTQISETQPPLLDSLL